MQRIAICLLLFATGCGQQPKLIHDQATRGPGQTYACISPRLDRLPLRKEIEQTREGWRLWIQAYSGPPAGWYSKGRIEYADGAVFYMPDSATDGIATERVEPAVRSILHACTPGHPELAKPSEVPLLY